MQWEFPYRCEPDYECLQCARRNVLFYYDGEVLDDKVKTKVEGITGCLNRPDDESYMLVKNIHQKTVCIKKGAKLGTISTVIEVPSEESVNTVVPEGTQSVQPEKVWTKEKFDEIMQMGDGLTLEQKDSIYTVLMDHREVLSTGDTDVGEVFGRKPLY